MLSEWKGITCQHRSDDFPLIVDVIERHRPTMVVELGTDVGGFASLLADTTLPWGGHVHTFDRESISDARLSRHPNLSRHLGDLLEAPGNVAVSDLLRGSTHALLYCDNGDKQREIALYAPHLSVGSLLATHDYEDEVDPAWSEPFVARLGFEPHRHGDFAALANEWYPHSLTRFWLRVSRPIEPVFIDFAQNPPMLIKDSPLSLRRRHRGR